MTENFSLFKMKVEQWLAEATIKLEKAGIGSARLDSLILLEDCLGKDRSHILAHPEIVISKTRIKKLNSQLKRRLKYVPMAYIRGYTEFFGRKFRVNAQVLEPRPESETMIEQLIKLRPSSSSIIADVGTGSGCLGITAALELHNHKVDLYDIDANALAVAKHNMHMHELRLRAYKRDLLRHYVRHYDIILANLPYIPDHYKINQPAAMEPKIAIFGGTDGLDIYRRFFEQLSKFSWKPAYIFTESLPPQHAALTAIAETNGFKLKSSEDFIQVFKAV